MALLETLKKLKNNVFGGPGNTGFTKPPISSVNDIGLTEGPTGLLSTDPLSFNTLSYPQDVQINYQNGHYMLFYVNVQDKTKYTYPKREEEDVGIYERKDIWGGDLKGETNREKRYALLKAAKKGTYKTGDAYDQTLAHEGYIDDKSSKKGVQSRFNNTKRITDSVAIYLPPNVEDNTTATYNDFRTGLVGFLAAAGVDIANQSAEEITRSLVDAGGTLLGEGAKKAVSEIAEMTLGAEGTKELINKAFGVADNPYMEVLFDAMGLRTFTYNFVFAPRNEKEALEVQKIIQLFRFHMAPELRGGQSRFLGLPSQFDIHYMYLSKEGSAMENIFYNKISTCVLQQCNVNYTPNGVKSFKDGGPTQMTMSLQFKETELLTKDKISEGY